MGLVAGTGTRMVAGRMRVTVNQKILVHLLDYVWGLDRRDAPPETTQQGIADALRARRSHITLALNTLEGKGLVEARSARIADGSRRKKAYSLTPRGYERARETRGILESLSVHLLDDGTEIAVSRIAERLGRPVALRDLLPFLRADGALDPRSLAGRPTG